MEGDTLNPIAAMLKTLKLSSIKRTLDSFLETGDVMFSSFDIYDNWHPVNEDLKDIAIYV